MTTERSTKLIVQCISDQMSRLRKARDLSLQDVADRAGLTKSHIWEMEQGRSANPTIDTAIRIASALGISFDQLIGADSSEPAIDPDAMRIACEVDALLRKARSTKGASRRRVSRSSS